MTVLSQFDFDLHRATLTIEYPGGRRTRIYRFPPHWSLGDLRVWANRAIRELIDA